MSEDLSIAQGQFRALIDRILRCREAEDEAKADTKEVYAELAGIGYDKTIAGKLVAEIRARAKNPDKQDEQNAILDLYREAYRGSSHVHADARTREADFTHSATTKGDDDETRPVSELVKNDRRHLTDTAGHERLPEAEHQQPVANLDDDAPGEGAADETSPTFSQRKPYALRPNCQDRENCGGYGAKHCHKCTVAASLAEEAA